MDSLQRMLSRQWTDMSQKRSSKRLVSSRQSLVFDDSDLLKNDHTLAQSHHQHLIEREAAKFHAKAGKPMANRWPPDETMHSHYPLEIGYLNVVELGSGQKADGNKAIKKVLKASSNVVKQRVFKSAASDSRLVTKLANTNNGKATQPPKCEDPDAEERCSDHDQKLRDKLSSLVQKRGPERQHLLLFEEIATV